jgi:hypothetical protein
VTRIVTTVHRYKRPPRKRKAVANKVPAIVRKRALSVEAANRSPAEKVEAHDIYPRQSANDDPKPAIVTVRRRGKRNADVPDMTSEEFQQRVDAADARWLELVRAATSRDRP